MTQVVRGDEWNALVAALRGSRSVLLVGHVNPDPDALGSSLALGLALRDAGWDGVEVSFDADPFVVPRACVWLPGVDELVVPPDEVMPSPDCVVALDCAAVDRLGGLLPVANRAPVFAVLDHHRSNPGFGGINVVDPEAAATGELVAELIADLGIPWSRDIATNLYAAISSDTGSFRFPATTAATHELAARLLATGIDHARLAVMLFSNRPLVVARLAGRVVSEAEYFPDAAGGAGLLVGRVSRGDRAADAIAFDEVESVVGDLAAVGAVDVAVLLKEDDHGLWRVSARSKGAVDLGAFATRRGGGGHTGAAGYSGVGDADAITADLLAGVAEFLVAG